MNTIDDEVYEGEEYFTLSVADPSGFENVSVLVTIIDNDGKYILYTSL